jgi:vitamin B12/bleomycin/antimicrobial peptide transport system ATP-binding/permease protein
MPEPILSRVAKGRTFLSKVWKLAAPYWWSVERAEVGVGRFRIAMAERWVARGLLLVILFLNIFSVYINKLFNDWYGRFYNALQDKDADAFWVEMRWFAILAFVYIVVAVYRLWLRQYLQIRWRQWLTDIYTKTWLGRRTYYRMELTGHSTDNPEQRIEQDIREFTSQTLFLTLDLVSEVLTLVTFSVILWNLSGTLVVPILGGIPIPGYMMWVAVVYAAIGSWLTYKVGRPLIRIAYDMERYNADFRYRMIRVRENAESIALYKGEPDENRRLGNAFGRVYAIWWDYMNYTKRLTWLTAFYGQAAVIFPFLVAAPRYFTGEIQLGVVMQTSSAFGQVQNSLSWFVNTYDTLAQWKATVDRLTGFSESMEAVRADERSAQGFDVAASPKPVLTLDDVEVALPNGRVLLEDVDLRVEPGQRVVIQGPSGSGKTTLFRVLAGLWPFGRGRVNVPRGAKVLFLPQKPYIPIGTLREAICYPDKPEAHDDLEIGDAMTAAELGHFAERLDETGNWSMVMSPGEQQRLSFARALLVRPDWLFLDEASSALDEATEGAMYRLLAQRLPALTMISIAHKPSVVGFHDRRVLLDPKQRRIRVENIAPSERLQAAGT